MSLDKAIEHGREHRRDYYGSRRFDPACRGRGGCPWCVGNRLHQRRVLDEAARQEREDAWEAAVEWHARPYPDARRRRWIQERFRGMQRRREAR